MALAVECAGEEVGLGADGLDGHTAHVDVGCQETILGTTAVDSLAEGYQILGRANLAGLLALRSAGVAQCGNLLLGERILPDSQLGQI